MEANNLQTDNAARTQPGSRWNRYHTTQKLLRRANAIVLSDHVIVGCHTRLGLGLLCLSGVSITSLGGLCHRRVARCRCDKGSITYSGTPANPLQLLLHCLLSPPVLLGLKVQTRGLLLQPNTVVSCVRIHLPTAEATTERSREAGDCYRAALATSHREYASYRSISRIQPATLSRKYRS
jgi:hypothetical protein